MKKKLLIGLLILSLVAVPLFAIACEEEVTPPAEEEEEGPPAEEEEEEVGVIELIFNDHNPAGPPLAAIDDWAAYIEEQSGGRLKITVIHGAALYTGDEVFRAVQTRACAGGHYVVDREDGFLLNLVITLPFMPWTEQHVEDLYMTLVDEFPEMQAEWEGVTIIGFMMMPFTHLHFVDKVVRTPDDIAGVKMMCAEAILAEVMNTVGATGVELPITDMAPSVLTGVVEGVMNHFPVLGVFGALELLPYHTVFGGAGINNTPMFLIMNTDVLHSLPSDLQALILNSGSVWFDTFKELDDADIAAAFAFCEENNHTMTYLTPAEIAVWYNLIKGPMHDAWIAECEAAGLPGQAAYDRALELAAE